jgi:hypothetical protein
MTIFCQWHRLTGYRRLIVYVVKCQMSHFFLTFLTITNTPKRQSNARYLFTLRTKGQLAQKTIFLKTFVSIKYGKRLREIVNRD